MSEVSLIGMGAMGSAFARALLRGGAGVTVWNRTRAKADLFAGAGAFVAPSVAAAVGASPVVVVCISDYVATRERLDTEEVRAVLAGKILVQLTTGSPQDARELEAWAGAQGADYLDGAVMATPNQIGRRDAPIFLSGSETAFRQSERVLDLIAGKLMFMGSRVGAASAWDLAVLSYIFGAMLGCFHGVRVCEQEDLRIDLFNNMIGDIGPVIGEMVMGEAQAIQEGAYGAPESALKTCAASSEVMLRHARESGINSEFPAFLAGLLRKGVATGLGEERLATIIKVLRQ
ncbi:NAD(P)-dependent oxidoreductase [Chondromyces apiculatus]|uniref:Putative Dehydrogenase n=1 Tax=Chondromyces apiculatus DSM 436 TaxID=1192034 RepID=A0A017STX9_9BACT|nr:NAD(P)-binding domain-containing protein [Chondromyces apiculatus]EYF00424.1 putative Dehydrogenase [Chondromyces apiculatus DSM 436]